MVSQNGINEFDTSKNEVGAGLTLPYVGLFSTLIDAFINDMLGYRLGLKESFYCFTLITWRFYIKNTTDVD